jgi:hypothetical protein
MRAALHAGHAADAACVARRIYLVHDSPLQHPQDQRGEIRNAAGNEWQMADAAIRHLADCSPSNTNPPRPSSTCVLSSLPSAVSSSCQASLPSIVPAFNECVIAEIFTITTPHADKHSTESCSNFTRSPCPLLIQNLLAQFAPRITRSVCFPRRVLAPSPKINAARTRHMDGETPPPLHKPAVSRIESCPAICSSEPPPSPLSIFTELDPAHEQAGCSA